MLNTIPAQLSATTTRKRRAMVVVKQYEAVNNREETSYKKCQKTQVWLYSESLKFEILHEFAYS